MGTGNDPSGRTVGLFVLVTVLVALAGCNGVQMGGNSGGGGDAAGGGAQLSADDGGGSGGGSYYRNGERVVVREADASLRVENFTRSFRRLRAIADRNGGFVGDRRQRSEGDWDTGTVTVRVPAGNFSSARDAVAGLGRLEEENVRALDFTGEYRDRQRRIRQLQRDRAELNRLLNGTENASTASDLREGVQEVRSKLRDLRREQSRLRERQALSTIRVEMHEPESEKPPRTYETAFGFADAFASAFHGGLTAVKYVVVFFGYAVPVGAAALLFGTFGFGLWNVWLRIQTRLTRLLGRGDASNGPSERGNRTDEEETDDG